MYRTTKQVLPLLTLAILIAGGAGCAMKQDKIGDSDKIQNTLNEDGQQAKNEITEDYAYKNDDSRILIEDADINYLAEACHYEWNTDPADSFIIYRSEKFGFVFNVPFNSKWGTDKYRVSPYNEELSEEGFPSIDFGPPMSWGTCKYAGGEFGLNVLSHASVDSVISSKTNTGTMILSDPLVKKLHGMTVVMTEYGDLCGGWNAEIIGENYNYAIGGCDMQKETLNKLIDGFQLITATR